MKANSKATMRSIPLDHSKRKKFGYAYVVDVRTNGKRTSQKYFKYGETEKAEAYLKSINKDLDSLALRDRSELTPEVQEQAVRAIKKLKKWNATIEEAVEHFLKHKEAESRLSDEPLSKVIGKLRDTKEKEGCSEKYLKDLRTRLDILDRAFPNRSISSLTSQELQLWIDQRGSQTTQANYRRILNVLFNYAKKRGIIEDNPIDQVDVVKGKTAKGFLTVEEATALLHHCPDEIIPAVAIMLFAGVRPDFENGELSRLEWKHIQFRKNTIRLDAEITKTESTRNVAMSENLIAWLTPHKQVAGKLVVNSSRFRKLWEKARREAGLFDNWIPDSTRKTFITYHVELCGNEHETMTQSGHTSVKTLRDHYKGLADKEDSEAYFQIMPGEQENVISISKRA